MRITKRQLRQIIKEEIFREEEEAAQPEKISAGEFVAALKGDLTQMMKVVPDAFNDELMAALKALVAASKYDASAFKKSVEIVLDRTASAVEKAESAS